MTTPPKVRIYRSKRRDPSLEEQAEAGQRAAQDTAAAERAVGRAEPDRPAPDAPNFPPPPSRRDEAPAETPDLAAQIEAVKAEELTGRKLRLARRIAAMHGIDVASDEEAVVVLRAQGIDPFHRSALNQLIAQNNENVPAAQGNQVALRGNGQPPGVLGQITPVKVPAKDLPSREALTEEKRAAEIMRIQRDIARRRRKKQFWLTVRLFLLVGIPTAIAGWYYFAVATPLYQTDSQFLIQQADSAAVATGTSMLSGLQLNPDSVAVQSYLLSKNAMLRLDEEVGFKAAYQDPAVDPLLRLPADANDDDAYKIYKKMVTVSYDPTQGVLGLKVIAPDPELAEEWAVALIRYAEGMVDDMTVRVRTGQVADAEKSYAEAEASVREAQDVVQGLQEQMGVLDPTSESGLVMNRIGQLESELVKKQLELAQLQANPRPNASRVEGVQGDIGRLEELIAETRAQLTEASGERGSLAQISGKLRIAEADLETRQGLLVSAAQLLEMARTEASKQVRYLSLSVAPVPPENATYPKALSNTIVAFLVFMGIYLMMSLTASILREQVSA